MFFFWKRSHDYFFIFHVTTLRFNGSNHTGSNPTIRLTSCFSKSVITKNGCYLDTTRQKTAKDFSKKKKKKHLCKRWVNQENNFNVTTTHSIELVPWEKDCRAEQNLLQQVNRWNEIEAAKLWTSFPEKLGQDGPPTMNRSWVRKRSFGLKQNRHRTLCSSGMDFAVKFEIRLFPERWHIGTFREAALAKSPFLPTFVRQLQQTSAQKSGLSVIGPDLDNHSNHLSTWMFAVRTPGNNVFLKKLVYVSAHSTHEAASRGRSTAAQNLVISSPYGCA